MNYERRVEGLSGLPDVHNPRGFTLIEVTLVSVLLAIATAVVLPKWSHSLDNTRVKGFRLAVETDVATLSRTCLRKSTAIQLVVNEGSSRLIIFPPQPTVIGDANGVIDYSARFPGIEFSQIDFNGNDNCKINHYGELVSSFTSEPLTAGLLTIQGGSATKTTDLLALRGGTSLATPTGQAEQPTSESNVVVTVVPEVGGVPSNTFKNSLLKLLGF